MTVYLDLVMVLNFCVDLLLLLGTNRLCGYRSRVWRVMAAAIFGGAYGAICLLPSFRFLGTIFWRIVSLGIMSIIAFGWNGGTLRRMTLFVFLSMALGGIALGLENKSFPGLLAGASLVALLCIIGFRGKATVKPYITVRIDFRGQKRTLTALQDTGNTLQDPVTGRNVLVVGADIAREMMGLTQEELLHPLDTMEKWGDAGLRLIPYHAVGQPQGMLLAIQPDSLLIGKEERKDLVAFAPQIIGRGEAYQALAGGVL